MPVVLYGCKTSSLALRDGHMLKGLENRVLRNVFRCKRCVVRGEWRRLHNEELSNLFSLIILFG